MNGKYIDEESKAEFAAKAVNRVIQSIIDKNFKGTAPLDRCKIVVIGYETEAKLLAKGTISQFANEPLEIVELKKKVSDGTGGLTEIPFKMPIWFKAKTAGLTNMAKAFELAEIEIDDYFSNSLDCPAPIIINISDGVPCVMDDQCEAIIDIESTTKIAQRISSKQCNDGNVLIFNAHIEANGNKIELPDREEELRDTGARFLFGISSPVPKAMHEAAGKSYLAIKPQSRGCMIACDAEGLINLINFGSAKAMVDLQ